MSRERNNYDAVIIGAGSTGIPASRSFAALGMKTLVIDSAPSPGQGSNKAAIGGVRATHSDPAKILLGLKSLPVFSTWKEIYGDEIEWSTGGYCFPVYTEKHRDTLLSLLEFQKNYNLDISWLPARELLDSVPDLNQEGLLGGTISPRDGHCSPLPALLSMYRQARREGVEFLFHSRVLKVTAEKERVTGVETERGSFHAPVVLNASGAWIRDIQVPTRYIAPVQGEPHEAGVTEPVAPLFKPLIVDLRSFPGSANCYFFQIKTGQVIFCLTPDPPVHGLDTLETSEFLPSLSRRILNLVPRLAPLRVRRIWRGLYPMTPDGLPLLGGLSDLEGYYLAGGMCGQGFMLGPGAGEVIAKRATGSTLSDEEEEILRDLSPERDFSRGELLR